MNNTYIFSIILVFSLTACAPQAELVRTRAELNDLRDEVGSTRSRVQDLQKRIDAADAGTKGNTDLQKNIADYGAKSDQLATDMQLLQGKIEENNYKIAELAQKLDDKSFKIAELSAKVEELEGKLKLSSGGTGTAPAAAKPAAKAPEPSDIYRQAKNDFDKKNFDLALAGYQSYVAQFPNASQADKAQYWVGECYYAKKEFPHAIEAFSKLLKAYPKSDKVAGAKLKIGYSYLNAKNVGKAREYLYKVIKEHPATTEAKLAKDKLKTIGK